MAGTDTSQISPYTASCGGGLVLNKDVYNMQPGEALQLVNFEPSVKGAIDDLMVQLNLILQSYLKYQLQVKEFYYQLFLMI